MRCPTATVPRILLVLQRALAKKPDARILVAYYARRLLPAQAAALGPTLRTLVATLGEDGVFRLRIDCALVPFLSADAELARDAVRLERCGVFGSEAGAALAAVTVDADMRTMPSSRAGPTT